MNAIPYEGFHNASVVVKILLEQLADVATADSDVNRKTTMLSRMCDSTKYNHPFNVCDQLAGFACAPAHNLSRIDQQVSFALSESE